MAIGDEFKSSGITANTPKTIMLGAGTIHKGLTFSGTDVYALTKDETFQAGKTYYTRSGSSGSYVYTAATQNVGASVTASTYYEKTITNGTWNFQQSLICATSGGSKLSITPELYDIPVDGALVKVKGLTAKVGETAQLEINPIELTPDILKMAVIGDAAESTTATGYSEIKSRAQIATGDYLTNMAYVGKTMEGKPIIILFSNALCTSGLELEGKNKEAAVPKFTFECYADLSPEADTLPWHIYYPTPVA